MKKLFIVSLILGAGAFGVMKWKGGDRDEVAI
jgi:hypothetical protein